MAVSANKMYKVSGSDLPFKEWLKREQLKGKLDVHERKFYNAVGDDDGDNTDHSNDTTVATNQPYSCAYKIIGSLVVGAAIGYGVSIYFNKRK